MHHIVRHRIEGLIGRHRRHRGGGFHHRVVVLHHAVVVLHRHHRARLTTVDGHGIHGGGSGNGRDERRESGTGTER